MVLGPEPGQDGSEGYTAMLIRTDTDDDDIVRVENIRGPGFQSSKLFENYSNQKKIVKNLRDDSKMVDFASDGKTGPGSAQECRIYFAQKLHYTLHLSPQGTLRKTTDRLRIGFAQKET